MSSLRQPSGPLPPRVYWTRRLFVLVGLVLVVALAWWAVDRATATGASSSPPASTASRHPTSPRPKTPAPKTSGTSRHTGSAPQGSTPTKTPTAPQHSKQQPLPAVPTHALGSTPAAAAGGSCDAATIGIAIHATPMTAGNPHNITLWLTGPPGSSCKLSVGPDRLVLQVTSGSDRVWTSDECPEALPVKNVQITAGSPARYTFQWDGFRSVKGCRNTVTMARPGGYWVHAALLGGEPTEAYFTVKPRA